MEDISWPIVLFFHESNHLALLFELYIYIENTFPFICFSERKIYCTIFHMTCSILMVFRWDRAFSSAEFKDNNIIKLLNSGNKNNEHVWGKCLSVRKFVLNLNSKIKSKPLPKRSTIKCKIFLTQSEGEEKAINWCPIFFIQFSFITHRFFLHSAFTLLYDRLL